MPGKCGAFPPAPHALELLCTREKPRRQMKRDVKQRRLVSVWWRKQATEGHSQECLGHVHKSQPVETMHCWPGSPNSPAGHPHASLPSQDSVSPSCPVGVPSASCPVPWAWRKAPILADQAALCRTLAFLVGGFPCRAKRVRAAAEPESAAPWPCCVLRHSGLEFAAIVFGLLKAGVPGMNHHAK